jgi:toxin ParE1/3/4
MKRIRVSSLAERDLDEIWYEIAKRSGSIEIADRVVDSITDAFPLFAKNPEAGRQRDELKLGVRSFPVGRYLIYYRRSGQYLVISRVIHGMRDQMAVVLEGMTKSKG